MRLADQGLNVVLVAKPDSLLDETHAEMQSIYKNLQVRKASMTQKPHMNYAPCELGVMTSNSVSIGCCGPQ